MAKKREPGATPTRTPYKLLIENNIPPWLFSDFNLIARIRASEDEAGTELIQTGQIVDVSEWSEKSIWLHFAVLDQAFGHNTPDEEFEVYYHAELTWYDYERKEEVFTPEGPVVVTPESWQGLGVATIADIEVPVRGDNGWNLLWASMNVDPGNVIPEDDQIIAAGYGFVMTDNQAYFTCRPWNWVA